MLQALDVLTTLAGFTCGLGEANPAINQFFPAMGPLAGLLLAKSLTVIFSCWIHDVQAH